MSVTLLNLGELPPDLAPGSYCCRLDESTSLLNGNDFRARIILPPRPHVPGDCLIQMVKTEGA